MAGAIADPVKDYLKQIGKVPLLNAEQEVELAKRIEAGLSAEQKLAERHPAHRRPALDLEWIADDGTPREEPPAGGQPPPGRLAGQAVHRPWHAVP